MKTAITTALLWCLATTASAAPIKLDFEGLGNGALVLDYFNGGTDSQGNVGFNYGITFPGAVAVKDANGGYIKAFEMIFDPAIAYNSGGLDDTTIISFLYRLSPGQTNDPQSNFNVTVFMVGQGADVADIVVPEPGYFAADSIQGPSIYYIDFNGLYVDDIQFGVRVPQDLTARPVVSAVPEPSPVVLIGAGLAALIWVRRRKDTREQA